MRVMFGNRRKSNQASAARCAGLARWTMISATVGVMCEQVGHSRYSLYIGQLKAVKSNYSKDGTTEQLTELESIELDGQKAAQNSRILCSIESFTRITHGLKLNKLNSIVSSIVSQLA